MLSSKEKKLQCEQFIFQIEQVRFVIARFLTLCIQFDFFKSSRKSKHDLLNYCTELFYHFMTYRKFKVTVIYEKEKKIKTYIRNFFSIKVN